MNAGSLVNFIGWASLTFMWLKANRFFFSAIVAAIHDHDEQVGINAIVEYEARRDYESEDENEDE